MKKIIFHSYSKCSTCRKAAQWLDKKDFAYQSIDLIKATNKASTSFLQRNFQIGYNKAARIMEALEQRGVVSQPNHTGKRDILINT